MTSIMKMVSIPLRRWSKLLAAIAAGWLGTVAFAIPDGGTWEYGNGTITYSGGGQTLTIDASSNNSIINWLRFNIANGESVYFNLPGSSSRILNRIDASNGISFINGVLASNGQVYLVNPAGITFGANSILNANRIYAAAGDMSSDDFLSGIDRFTNLQGEVINQGSVTANEVHFVGHRVVNDTTGVVQGGLISFSTGNEVWIQRVGDGISIRIDGQDLGEPQEGTVNASLDGAGGIENHGSIIADPGGAIHLAAGDLHGLALLNTGTIQATGGTIQLTARGGAIHNDVSGVIDVSNSTGNGGDILIQGPVIVNRGLIAANTDAVGGEAGSIDVRAHTNAIFTETSNVEARGNIAGSGGEINIEATNGTVYLAEGGTLDVKGGLLGGDGGTVSITGSQVYHRATTKVGAINGADGSLSVTVDESIVTTDGSVGDPVGDPSGLDLTSAINVTSQIGTNVLHMFDGDVSIDSSENVSVIDGFHLNGHDLDINAGSNINLFNEVTGLNDFTLTAADTIEFGDSFTDIAGNAAFTASEIRVNASSPVSIETGGWQTWDGDVVLQETDLSVTAEWAEFTGTIDSDGPMHASELSIDVDGELRMLGSIGASGALGAIDLSADLITLGGTEINAYGDILLNGDGHAEFGEAATIVGLADSLSITSFMGNILLGQNEVFTQLGDLSMESTGLVRIGDVNTLGDFSVTAPNIEIMSREGGHVLQSDGTHAFSPGVACIAGGSIFFSSTPTILGTLGADPVFASVEESSSFVSTLSGFETMQQAPLDMSDFTFGDVVLNLIPVAADNGGGGDPGDGTDDSSPGGSTPDGLQGLNISPLLASAEQVGATEGEPLETEDPEEGVLADSEGLIVSASDLSIDVEILTDNPDDQQGSLTRADILANYPVNNVNPATGNIRVKQRRLNRNMLRKSLVKYQDLLALQPGDVEANLESNNTSHIADSIKASWAEYAESQEGDPTGAGFGDWMNSDGSQVEARQYILDLREVFSDLNKSGLSSGEFAYARFRTIERIMESSSEQGGMTPSQLSATLGS